jgi:hypothetical protein
MPRPQYASQPIEIIILSFCLAVNDNHHYRLINAQAVNEIANQRAGTVVFGYYLRAIYSIAYVVDRRRTQSSTKNLKLRTQNFLYATNPLATATAAAASGA